MNNFNQNSENPTIRSIWAKAAFMMLGIFWASVGWFILVQGGFTTTQKYSHQTTYVDGAGAIFVAFVFLILANVSIAIVFQNAASKRPSIFFILSAALLMPPVIFLLQK